MRSEERPTVYHNPGGVASVKTDKQISLIVPGTVNRAPSQTEPCPGCRPKGPSVPPNPGCEGRGLTTRTADRQERQEETKSTGLQMSRILKLLYAPIRWAVQKYIRLLAVDRWLVCYELRADELNRLLELSHATRPAGKLPRLGSLPGADYADLLSELDPVSAEYISTGKLLVSGTMYFSILGETRAPDGGVRTGVVFATQEALDLLPIPHSCCQSFFPCRNSIRISA